MADDKITIMALGDRQNGGVPWDEFKKQVDPLLPVLKQADFRYQVLEAAMTDKGRSREWGERALNPNWGTSGVNKLTYTLIDMVTCNGNHSMDGGHVGMIETLETLEKNKIAQTGAGRNIEEARKPYILNKKGTKIAFLCRNSEMRAGDEANAERSGCAPLRIHTFHDNVESAQPGLPAAIRTFPYPEDMADMVEDIKKAKKEADIVIMCLHQGYHFVRQRMADYQYVTSHAAIDAGADMVLGSHPHLMKAVEVYKGKVIWHCLSNFGFEYPHDAKTGEPRKEIGTPAMMHDRARRYGISYKQVYEDDPWGSEPCKTGIVKIEIAGKKIQKVVFLPVMWNHEGKPIKVLKKSDKNWDVVVNTLKECTDYAELPTKFVTEGDEVVISTK